MATAAAAADNCVAPAHPLAIDVDPLAWSVPELPIHLRIVRMCPICFRASARRGALCTHCQADAKGSLAAAHVALQEFKRAWVHTVQNPVARATLAAEYAMRVFPDRPTCAVCAKRPLPSAAVRDGDDQQQWCDVCEETLMMMLVLKAAHVMPVLQLHDGGTHGDIIDRNRGTRVARSLGQLDIATLPLDALVSDSDKDDDDDDFPDLTDVLTPLPADKPHSAPGAPERKRRCRLTTPPPRARCTVTLLSPGIA